MSRVRRLSYAISENGRRANATKQALRLRDSVLGILEEVNQNTSVSRRVTKRSAFTVVLRSLQKTRNLPFSLREHMAIKELSNYINLAQNNKVNSLTLSNTDLLPISHPRSARQHTLTASALRNAQSQWFADDPRITDERARIILASAFSSEVGSVEHTYYTSVLSGLPQGSLPTEALLAAFGDGNSPMARSLRAQLQRRDRLGRFAYQGGGLRNLVKRAGGIFSLTGRVLMDLPDGRVQVELADGRIVALKPEKGEYIKAVLPGQSKDGYSPTPAKNVSMFDEVTDEAELESFEAPNGWEKDGNVWKNENWSVEIDEERNFKANNGEGGEVEGKGWADILDAIDDFEKVADNQPEFKPEQEQKQQEAAKPAAKFEFNYPDGAFKIFQGRDYDPEGRQDEDSPDFTDDPVELAQKFEASELIDALEQAVLPQGNNENAFGYGALRFGRGDELVPAEAIHKALEEAGEDADLELARIYDKALGTDANEKALLDSRKAPEQVTAEMPDVAEAFERVTKENTPDVEPAAEVPEFVEEQRDETPLPPLLQGLTENELARFMESKDHTPHLPKNFDIADDQIPEGYNKLDPAPFKNWREVTEEDADANLPAGFSDNPVFLAQNVSKEELLKEFRRSLEPGNEAPGYGAIKLTTDDGEEFVANVPGEAIRDALQLQGEDTNLLTTQIYAEAGNLVELNDEDAAEVMRQIMAQEGPFAPGAKAPAARKAPSRGERGAEKEESPSAEIPTFKRGDEDPNYLPGALPKMPGFQRDPEETFDLRGDRIRVGDRVLHRGKYKTVKSIDGEGLSRTVRFEEEFPGENNYLVVGIKAHSVKRPLENDELESVTVNGEKVFKVPNGLGDWELDNFVLRKVYGKWTVRDKNGREKFGKYDTMEDAVAAIQERQGKKPTPTPAQPSPLDKPENKAALDKFNKEYVKDLLNEEEALADKLQAEEDMPRGDAQAVAEAEMKKKYGKTAIEALNELSREDALEVLDEREKEIQERPAATAPEAAPKAEKKTIPAEVPQEYEVDALGEIPDGNAEYPKPADVAPADIGGGDGPKPPYRIRAKVKDLQPGDITVGDNFVITKIGEKVEGTNRLAIEGYYPGHVIQNTKQWVEDTEIEVIRGVDPLPEQGDLPVLSKPKMRDFGKVYKDKADNQWKLRDPDAQAAYDAAWAEYVAQAEVAKKKFVDPTEPSNNPHRAIVRAADLKPGDITADPKKGHFVVERVFVDDATKPGFVSIEGYYPGYGTQRKEWKVDTQIDVIRNVEAPAKGEGELHRPNKVVNGKWIPDKDPAANAEWQKKIEEAGARFDAPKDLPVVDNKEQAPEADKNIPNVVVARKPAKKRTPDFPAFQGEWAAIARRAGGDWKKFREELKDKTLVFFDFETTGIKDADGNEPWQVAAIKVRNGEIIDRVNIFMNPGRSVKDVWAGQDTDGKPNAVDADGNKLTDEFLAKQPSQAEAMKQFFDWVGPDALLAAHYVQFDDEVARRMADKHGLDYAPAGLLDTKAMAKDIFKDAPEKPAGNRLGQLAEFLDVKLDNWHAADADAEAVAGIFDKLIDKGIELDAGKDLFDVDARAAEYEKALADFEAAKAQDDQAAADFAAAKALKDALDGKEVKIDDVVADAENKPALDPEGINMGPVDAPLDVDGIERRDDGVVILDFTPNAVYPKGEMRMMPRDWVLDDKNAVLLDREDARMRNILPGDFMQSKDGSIIWQVVAVRAGEDNGFQPGRVRIYRRDIETGEMNVYEHWHGTRLDGVRRPINPSDLDIPEGNPNNEFVSNQKAAPESEQTLENSQGKGIRKAFAIGDKTAVVKIEATEDGIIMNAELFDADGNSIFKADGKFRTFAGAEAEADALLKEFADDLKAKEREEAAEPAEARAKDVPISRGDIPADAFDAPETIEVENMPAGLNGQISIRETGDDKPNYEVDAVVQDADGENLAEHHSEHPSKVRAEKEGRDWVARAAEGIQNTEAPTPEESAKKKITKPKKEVPQDEKVRFSQLNEEEQAEVLRNVREIEAIAEDMAGIKVQDVKVGDFLKHRQLGHYEKVVRIERGKEWGMDRIVLWVYNPIAGKEQPRPFKADSPLEFVRRVGGEGPVPKEPVGKPRGRAKRPDIRRQDPKEKVVVREGRIQGAKGKDRGFFKDANGEPVRVGDVVIHADPAKAAKLGRGIVRRRVGDQVDEGKKVGGVPRAGKVYLDNVFVQWENEDVAGQINQGGRQVVADNLIIVKADKNEVVANLAQKPWRGGVAKPNSRNDVGVDMPNIGESPAPAPKERIDAAPIGMPENIVKKTVKDLNDGEFELSLVKIGDVYEGAVIDKANGKIQIVVRDKNEQNARVELARAGDYIQQAAAGDEAMPDLPDLDMPGNKAQAPAAEQNVNLPSEDDVEKQFMLKGSQFVRDNGVKVLDKLENVKVGDFIMSRRGNIGRVIGVTEVGGRIQMKVRYRSGDEFEYRPYRKDLQLDGLYRVPTKENPDPQAAVPRPAQAKSPTPAAPANAVDIPEAARRLAIAKKKLPKIKDVYRGSEKDGIRAVNAAYKALKDGDVDRFNIYADRAARRFAGKDKYNDFLDDLDVIKNGLAGNANLPRPMAPSKDYKGPDAAQLDPVAVAQERKDNGVNPVQLSPFWQDRFVKSPDFWADLARKGIYGDQLKAEIQQFFADGEAKPLAGLSPEARKMLAGIANEKLLDKNRPVEESAQIKDIVDLAHKLQAERLAYEPNQTEWGAGAALADVDIKDLERVAPRSGAKGTITIGGREFFVQRMGIGGGRYGTNRIFKLVDMETGRRYFFKQDEDKRAVDSELAAVAFLRAAGGLGAYLAMRHNSNPNVVITTEAGENLRLGAPPKQGHEITPNDVDFVRKGHAAQAMVFAMVDALIDNQDRHMNNFLGAMEDNMGVNAGDRGKLMLLPLDQGLGDVFMSPKNAETPFDFLHKGYGRSGIPRDLIKSMGRPAYYELLQMTGQQALQALRRDYPAGQAPEVDIIVQRLEQLLAVPLADWEK